MPINLIDLFYKCARLLFFNQSTEGLIALYSYMTIYNLSILVLFWTLFQFINFNFKTLYSFSDLKLNFYFVTVVSITLFSMAGVPPFIGFLSKLLILLILANSNFFFFFSFFFGLLFFGLYFYLQNIRFLYSTGTNKLSYAFSSVVRTTTLYLYITFILLFFFIFGFFFFDDLILYFSWLLQ